LEGSNVADKETERDANISGDVHAAASLRSSDQPLSPIHYDLVVIGSGQCGNPLASAFFAKGKRVAVIERGAVGGTCVNYGCTPTKAMVASAEVAYLAKRSVEFGVKVPGVETDVNAVVARKRGIVAASRKSSEKRFEKGIDLLRGTGYFTGPKQVRVRLAAGGVRDLTADIVVIDTGLSPALPEVDGIDTVPHLDNVSIMELDRLPKHLLILGGGYVGLEFAQMFRRFGSEVTIVQRGPQLLAGEDADVAEEVSNILREDGIAIHLNAKATSVSSGSQGIQLTVSSSEGILTLQGSDLLVATGRKPNSRDLNLDAAGVSVDERGYIRVNEKLETSVEGIYTVGDVNGGPAFTHISYDDFRVLKSNLLDGGDRMTTGRPLPYCVFIDPQLARVGLSENAAKHAGKKYKLAKVKMSSVARAYETGQTRGFMKALVDPDTEEILGAAILGADGGELMSMVEIAMMGKLPYTALRDAIFAHPTFAESLNILFASLDS
jgi:pyruvate/2-oxoglutarate dehydrogenase complex dihydrolipoamide dehydrogenase (E3) component